MLFKYSEYSMNKYHYIGLTVLFCIIMVVIFVKPIKIFVPEVTGVTCVETWLCIDDINKLTEANLLYNNAINKIEFILTKFHDKPKMIFCSTTKCFSRFGLNKAAAKSFGTVAVVVAPRGWKPFYIRHELIHQWQSENFGSISSWLAESWIIEGMAYFLSADPRKTLSEPFQSYRYKYGNTYGHLKKKKLKAALENEI